MEKHTTLRNRITKHYVRSAGAILALTAVFKRLDVAEYYFRQTFDGQELLFPVHFVRENGTWKVPEF